MTHGGPALRILAFDTATSAITAAVHDGDQVRAEEAVLDNRRHTEALAPVIERVLTASGTRMAEVTHIAVGIGPGPFTGLRVGIVTALVLGSALQIPVHGVCSLDALAEAHAGRHDGDLLVATDARRTEVYWARYAAAEGHATRVTDPAVTKPADLPPDARTLPCAGRGPLLYHDILVNAVAPQDVSAGVLAALAASEIHRGVRTEPVPMYLRRPDAQEPAAPKPALPTSGRP